MRPTFRVFLVVLTLFALATVLHAQPIQPPGPPVIPDRGALILFVQPNSPAHEAGLQPGDLIVAINGMPVANIEFLNDTVRSSMVVRLEVIRNEDTRRGWIMVAPRNGELGIVARMVDPQVIPLLPLYRRT